MNRPRLNADVRVQLDVHSYVDLPVTLLQGLDDLLVSTTDGAHEIRFVKCILSLNGKPIRVFNTASYVWRGEESGVVELYLLDELPQKPKSRTSNKKT